MGRRAKYTQGQKTWACEQYLNGNLTAKEIAKALNMSPYGDGKVREWSRSYQVRGSKAFENSSHNQIYTKEFKLQVVQEYLTQRSTLSELAIEYGIPSSTTIAGWISRYNKDGEIKDHRRQREGKMKAGKKTTLEERVEIANYCLEHERNYKKTAEMYGCSYGQVRNWTIKFEQGGEEALRDGRGRAKEAEELTEQQRLEREIEVLKRKNKYLEMENELLKKAEEWERRWIKQQ